MLRDSGESGRRNCKLPGLRHENLAISSQQTRQKTTLAQWVKNSSRAPHSCSATLIPRFQPLGVRSGKAQMEPCFSVCAELIRCPPIDRVKESPGLGGALGSIEEPRTPR